MSASKAFGLWHEACALGFEEGGRMEKIQLGTRNGVAENIDRLSDLFPQVVTEVENSSGGVRIRL